ncbi:PGPGW domain-containing protein [Leifsonia sp. YIM 134122]|uniref:PGPGW domain-containing protein n=1 Tax=Leifsonia stereocauli TaxID=3134136 RepID=A0ABU9W788_9MICO
MSHTFQQEPQGAEPTRPTTTRRVGAALGRATRSAAHGTRETIRRNPTVDKAYRAGVGVVGGGTLALGIVMIPLPGPGALVVLGGLGILSTEFDGAKAVSSKANEVVKKGVDVARHARDRRRAAKDASAGRTPEPEVWVQQKS